MLTSSMEMKKKGGSKKGRLQPDCLIIVYPDEKKISKLPSNPQDLCKTNGQQHNV